jgi:hypothetical protein
VENLKVKEGGIDKEEVEKKKKKKKQNLANTYADIHL